MCAVCHTLGNTQRLTPTVASLPESRNKWPSLRKETIGAKFFVDILLWHTKEIHTKPEEGNYFVISLHYMIRITISTWAGAPNNVQFCSFLVWAEGGANIVWDLFQRTWFESHLCHLLECNSVILAFQNFCGPICKMAKHGKGDLMIY